MAKQNVTYKIFSNVSGDLYTSAPKWRKIDGGKFVLDDKLTQRELKYLFETGHTDVVYEVRN